MKKRWIVAVVLSGAAAGVMIYDGGKLLLGYRDIWQGGMALFAGFLQIPLFAWSIFRSVPGKETQWEEPFLCVKSDGFQAQSKWCIAISLFCTLVPAPIF